jgi:hypothetical protein
VTDDALSRLRHVDSAIAALSDAATLRSGLQAAASAVVPEWVDLCVVGLAGAQSLAVAAAESRGHAEPLVKLIESAGRDDGGSIADVLSSGRPRLFADGIGPDPRTQEVTRSLGVEWLLMTPIPPARRSLGCLVVAQTSASGRVLDQLDIELGSTLARAVWMAARVAADADLDRQPPPAPLPAKRGGLPVFDPATGTQALEAAIGRGDHVLLAIVEPMPADADLREVLRPTDVLVDAGEGNGWCAVVDARTEAAGRRFDSVVEELVAAGVVALGVAERTPGDTAEGLVGRARLRVQRR